jgi:hypothetical protein
VSNLKWVVGYGREIGWQMARWARLGVVGSGWWLPQFVTGLSVPCNGPFCACINGLGSCPPMGLSFGPNPAQNNFVSCRVWAVLFLRASCQPTRLGQAQMYSSSSGGTGTRVGGESKVAAFDWSSCPRYRVTCTN